MSNGSDNPKIAELVSSLMRDELPGESWFDFGRDPAAAEQIGRALAAQVSEFQATAVVSWLDSEETVLAHIVARELGAVRTGVQLDLGLLTIESELPAGSRVVLVSTFWDGQRPLHSLRTLFEGRGHTVVAAASLVPSAAAVAAPADLSLITLVG
ncbi:MAG: hypothetical protein ACOH1K_04135 [Rhodoglobus sp.]